MKRDILIGTKIQLTTDINDINVLPAGAIGYVVGRNYLNYDVLFVRDRKYLCSAYVPRESFRVLKYSSNIEYPQNPEHDEFLAPPGYMFGYKVVQLLPFGPTSLYFTLLRNKSITYSFTESTPKNKLIFTCQDIETARSIQIRGCTIGGIEKAVFKCIGKPYTFEAACKKLDKDMYKLRLSIDPITMFLTEVKLLGRVE